VRKIFSGYRSFLNPVFFILTCIVGNFCSLLINPCRNPCFVIIPRPHRTSPDFSCLRSAFLNMTKGNTLLTAITHYDSPDIENVTEIARGNLRTCQTRKRLTRLACRVHMNTASSAGLVLRTLASATGMKEHDFVSGLEMTFIFP
jgi:hypothetical protein